MELKKVNTNNGNFFIHENLKGEDSQEAFIKSLSEEERASLVQLYPPFFLRKEETLILVGRWWVYFHCMKNRVVEYNALITDDTNELEKIFNLMINENAILKRFSLLQKKPTSRTTKDRENNKRAGKVCPFCGGTVRHLNTKKEREKDGGFVIHCEKNILNKKSKNYMERCLFYLVLTPFENDLFVRNELGLSEIIARVDGKQCPKSQSPLYVRTVHMQDSITFFERCRDFFDKTCAYNKRIDIGYNHETTKEVTE